MINVDICSVIQVCFCLRSWGVTEVKNITVVEILVNFKYFLYHSLCN